MSRTAVTEGAPGFILAVSGLAREAAIASGTGRSGSGGRRARAFPCLIEAAIAEGAAGILSFGIAGGLDPTLPPGTAILAEAVIAGGERWTADAAWRERLAARLPDARLGDLAGVDLPVMTQADKQALAAATRRARRRHGIPYRHSPRRRPWLGLSRRCA